MCRLSLVAIVMGLLAACAPAKPSAVATLHGVGMRAFVTPAVAGETNDVRLEVAGSPDRAGAISFDMPGMPMHPGALNLRRVSDGVYEVGGVDFSMAGRWQMTVWSARRGAKVVLATLDFTVR